MRVPRTPIVRTLAGALLAGTALLGSAAPAAAEDSSASPGPDGDPAGPTEAGTAFRTATAIEQDRPATAEASTGDYLYWVFPTDVGRRATVTATVTLPEDAARHGASTWQIDLYDGLRRRQPCMYGRQTAAAAVDAGSVELSCTLRPVRAWAEPWANDPLPGSYYIRLTVVDLPEQDLGLPVRTEVEATTVDAGGAHAVDGSLSAPLVPGIAASARDGAADPATGVEDGGEDGTDGTDGTETEPSERRAAAAAPDGGWSSGWWSDRWIWTAVGGVLGALAGIAGYSLTRGSGRPARMRSDP